MRVKLTKEQKIQVLNSVDVYDVMQRILLRENKIDRSKEHFWVVCLSTRNRILLIELVSLGTMKGTPRGPHGGVQLRAPEAGVQVDHGPQPPGRHVDRLPLRIKTLRTGCTRWASSWNSRSSIIS